MVSGKVGVILIGIGIITVVLLTPRGIISPEKVSGFVGTFGLQPAQAMISPKPTQVFTKPQLPLIQESQIPITVTAKPEQIAGVRQPITLPLIKTEPTLEPAKAFPRFDGTRNGLFESPFSPLDPTDPSVTTAEEREAFDLFFRMRQSLGGIL